MKTRTFIAKEEHMFKLIKSSKKGGNKSWKPHNHHGTDVIANTTCRPSYYILVFWFLYAIFFVTHCHTAICVGIGTYHSVSLQVLRCTEIEFGLQNSWILTIFQIDWQLFHEQKREKTPQMESQFFLLRLQHLLLACATDEFGFLNDM